MRTAGLIAVIVLGLGLPQLLLGPTVVGAAVAVLACVYLWGLRAGPLSRVAVRREAVRSALVVGALLGLAYAGLGISGLVELPTTGAGLVVASAMLTAVSTASMGILVLCGLDAAVTSSGGYASADGDAPR